MDGHVACGTLYFMLLLEYWQPIPGFDRYEASYSGKLRHKDKIIKTAKYGYGWSIGRMLEPTLNKTTGYRCISLTVSGLSLFNYVHILVATVFHPNPDGLPQVNHLNGFKDDNRACNLEWCTAKENMQHAAKMGLLGRKKKELAA